MANTILMKNRASDATKPADDNLKQGELAVNSFDGSIYMGTKLAVSGTAGSAATASTWVAGNIKDEDTMSSNSATALATQQSIKAYVDSTPAGDLTAIVAGTGMTGTNLSGPIPTLNVIAGTGIAVAADAVALSHLGIESLSDPDADRIMFWDDSASATAFLTAGSGLTISGTTITADDTNTTYSAGTLLDLATTTFNVDLSEATEAAMTVADDYVLFLDGGTSGTAAKEKWADLAALIAGTNITATNGVLAAANDNTTYSAGTLLDLSSTTFNVDLTEAGEAAVTVADDYFLFLDGGATGTHAKESMADYATAIAGSNITATNGVLAAANDNTTYSAGTDLDLSGTTFSLETALDSVVTMYNTSLIIGSAASQEIVDFSTANEVNTKINDTERLSVTATGVDVTGNLTVSGDTTVVNILAGAASNTIQFEGTADGYETTLTVVDPTADRTISLPNATGTVSLSDTNTTYTAGNGLLLSGTTFTMDDPANGTSIDEGTVATDDRMPVWDESASSWKYVTIDNLQDEIDTDTNTTYSAGTLLDLATTTFNVDLSEASEAATVVADDYFLFLDGGASGTAAKESMVDYAALIAGTNITASNGVLSGTANDNTTYSAGNGISLSSTTFSVAGNTGLDQDSDGLSIDSSVCTLTGSQTLTNKGIDLGTNTLTGSVAEWNTAAQSESFCFLAETQTLTNKTIDAGAYST
jgi:hypothetical protein